MSHKPTTGLELSRRSFLKKSAMTVAGSGLLMSGLSAAELLQSRGNPIKMNREDRALVFLMLDGGNDSFNMLVPTSDSHYRDYQKSRANLALKRTLYFPSTASGMTVAEPSAYTHPCRKYRSCSMSKNCRLLPTLAPWLSQYAKSSFMPITSAFQ